MSLMNTYGERTTTLIKGDGVYLWDTNGKRYLDALSGIAVCGLGHNHPAVTQAINTQAQTLLHCSNLFNIPAQQALGDKLIALSGMEKVFFSNSGAEANEAAIKIARKYGQEKGIATPEIITANQSFHGRTMATLSATGNDKIKAGFAPLLTGFTHAEYGCIDSIKTVATNNTVAIMVEPIQGEGGVNVPYNEFLTDLRTLCDNKGWLLILDEIQTGNGRTGQYFCFQHSNILPDVVTTAKGLGNGVPIGACLAQGKATNILQPGNHGSTFGGNPLCCNAALATVNALTKNNLIATSAAIGNHMIAAFKERFHDNSKVVNVRGKGMMIGIQLNKPCAELVTKGKDAGIIFNVTAGHTIRLLPPLILNQTQADEIVNTVSQLIVEF